MARLLVVDDEQDICDLVVKRLVGTGHLVLAADGALTALALVDQHGPPDAAVLDVDMLGMAGFALLAYVVATYAGRLTRRVLRGRKPDPGVRIRSPVPALAAAPLGRRGPATGPAGRVVAADRRRGPVRADLAGRWASTGRRHRFEYLAVVLLSAAYTVAFGLDHDLPLAFPLLVMTVWAGLRLHTGFVIVHDVVFGSAAMLFTLAGGGPFAGDDLCRVRFVVVACRRGSSPSSGVGRALTNDQGVNSFRDPLTSAETAAAHCPTTLAPRSSARSATP